MIGQVEERRAELDELRLLFFRQNDILQMSRRCVEFRPFDQLVDLRIQAHDEVQDSPIQFYSLFREVGRPGRVPPRPL